MWGFIAARAKEIMTAMNPTRVVSFTPEMQPYNIHDYQSTHPTGGCIMGTDPGNSVTNSYGQVWDTPNVFVTGAALFPQNPGANPTGRSGRSRTAQPRRCPTAASTTRTRCSNDKRNFFSPCRAPIRTWRRSPTASS